MTLLVERLGATLAADHDVASGRLLRLATVADCSIDRKTKSCVRADRWTTMDQRTQLKQIETYSAEEQVGYADRLSRGCSWSNQDVATCKQNHSP